MAGDEEIDSRANLWGEIRREEYGGSQGTRLLNDGLVRVLGVIPHLYGQEPHQQPERRA